MGSQGSQTITGREVRGLALNLDQDAVERAILRAARQYSGCVGCRYSRASHNADEYARKRGALPVTMRGCVLDLEQETCSAFEPIIPD